MQNAHEVDDSIFAGGQMFEHILFVDVGFDQDHARQHGDVAILFITTGRDGDLHTRLDQRTGQMTANKTGATNEENFLVLQHESSLVDRLISS